MENNIISNVIDKYIPTVVDDFCGTGGLTLGCKQAGFRTLLALDNDPHAVESHRQPIGASG